MKPKHELKDLPYMKEILPIKDARDVSFVGEKAFNVAQMARQGVPVPEGFCITTRAYTYFINYHGIKEDETTSERIRDSALPPALERIIVDAYNKYLCKKPCAVRSSSPVEDVKRASFAGQYKSFLNVCDEKSLLNAVKECWASLWSIPAVEYRKKMSITGEVKMAVLVQEMIPATASGVLFTESDLVVEGVWGLGDILMNGEIIPDRFIVDKKGFTVKRTISHKTIMSQPAPGGGVEKRKVPLHLQDVPVLDDDQIKTLCIVGKKVEDFFGHPQDIEWILHDRIILLQARPITVLQGVTEWTRANISEMQSGYITYLSRPPENRPDFYVMCTLPLLKCFSITVSPQVKFVEYYYGHLYMNVTCAHTVLCKIPGLTPEAFDQVIGHTSSGKTLLPNRERVSVMQLIPGILRVIKLFLNLPTQAAEAMADAAALIKDIRQKDLHKMTLYELDTLVWKMYDMNQRVFQVHSCNALMGVPLLGLLRTIVRRYGNVEPLLITGLDGVNSYRLGVELWKLAQYALKSSRVCEIILSRKNIFDKLNQIPEGKAFLKDFNQFLAAFGDRCSEELELSTPRWEEDPEFVLSMVALYLTSDVNPVDKLQKQKEMRCITTTNILKEFSWNPLKKGVFKKILNSAQQCIVMRENLKTTWAKGLSVLRVLYLVMAEKLVEEKLLKTADDIFYMKMTEVSNIIAGTLPKKRITLLVQERTKEKKECEHVVVPSTIVGKPPPVNELQYIAEPTTTLKGIRGSPGVVTGTARVVLTPGACLDLKEGDILVAPVADPGWSPFFVIAKGLVMELGSAFSHGVIIAREYGLPAVVGVENATKVITTGQTITVDGNKGFVYVR